MPSLTRQRATLEKRMTDRIRITRGPNNTVRGPISKETGLDQNPPEPDTIYTGKAMVLDKSSTGASTSEGGEDIYRDYVRVRVPVAAGPFHKGDVVEVLACATDPQQVGRELVIDTIPYSTLAVSRILRCTQRTRGPRT